MYHLFLGFSYYPYGGMNDYQGSFETEEELNRALRIFCKQRPYEWANVAEVQDDGTLRVVQNFAIDPH